MKDLKYIDGQAEGNPDFYAYSDIQSIELNKLWYPRLVKWLRNFTLVVNWAPLLGEISKKANLVLQIRDTKLTIWLTDPAMVDKDKRLVELLKDRTEINMRF